MFVKGFKGVFKRFKLLLIGFKRFLSCFHGFKMVYNGF